MWENKVAMRTIILTVIFSLILSISASLPTSAELVDCLEAIVNKKPIFKSDVDQFKTLVGLRSKIDPLFASSPMSKKTNPTDDEIVQFLINEELIAQKYPVNDSEVEQEINGIQGNLKISREGLKQAIRAEGYKFEEYFKLMKYSLAKRQLLEREIRSKAAVTEDDVRNEYNKSKFEEKSFRGSFHLYLLKITQKNSKSPQAAKERIKKSLEAISGGETFETVAKSSSDDDSASNGGDLGFLSYGDLSPFIQKEVRKLGVGKISQVLDDGSNYYLLKITEVKSDESAGFEAAKNQIRSHLMEDEFQHQVTLWIERQRSTNYIKRNKPTSI